MIKTDLSEDRSLLFIGRNKSIKCCVDNILTIIYCVKHTLYNINAYARHSNILQYKYGLYYGAAVPNELYRIFWNGVYDLVRLADNKSKNHIMAGGVDWVGAVCVFVLSNTAVLRSVRADLFYRHRICGLVYVVAEQKRNQYR